MYGIPEMEMSIGNVAKCTFRKAVQSDVGKSGDTTLQPSGVPTARDNIRAWLRQVLETKGWTPNQLAKAAQVSASTLSRALNDDRFTTGIPTIEKVVRATGLPPPEGIGITKGKLGTGGFREPEATPMPARSSDNDADPNLSEWRLNSRALELAGYLPGDFVELNQTLAPSGDDVVCAQVYDISRGTAETVFRIFDPPYLVTRSLDERVSRKPLLIDNERVRVVGTVVRSWRLRPKR
jgi:transcriptional regulator with XRE-family HTH domain